MTDFTATEGPSHIELVVQVQAPGLSQAEAERRWLAAGNRILDVQGRDITAVAQVERVPRSDEDAVEGEFVWACDHCGAYSRSRTVAEHHEQTCEG